MESAERPRKKAAERIAIAEVCLLVGEDCPKLPVVEHRGQASAHPYPWPQHPLAEGIRLRVVHQGPETVAAIIAEPISAAYGVQVPPAEYWQRLREIADKYEVVLIADEVITAFGRTGEYFAPMNWGVQPDITAVAKSITSGYWTS